jgi:hypothetical protein
MRAEGYAPEMPARSKSGQILGPYPHGFEDRHIEYVFKASADFCYVRSLAEQPTVPKPQEPVRTSASIRPDTIEGGAHLVAPPNEAVSAEAPVQPDVVGRNEQNVERGPSPVKDAHVDLLEAILKKEPTTLEKWAKGHKLGRTTVCDWKALRNEGKPLTGKVSTEKSTEIEVAIKKDAQALGLTTRTHDSD